MRRKTIVIGILGALLGSVSFAVAAKDMQEMQNLVKPVSVHGSQRPSFPNQKRRNTRTTSSHRNTGRRRNSVSRHK